MRCTMLGALVLLSAAKVTVAQESSAEVEVVTMTIRHKPTIKGVRSFGDAGLELQLAVLAPGKPILAVDPGKSRIIRFMDDVGTDLAKGAPTGFFSWISLSNAFRKEPVETGLLDIATKSLPAKKAQRIEFEAVVALKSVSGTQEKSELLQLKKGTKITVGPIPMTLGDVGEPDAGGSALSIQISSEQSMDTIQEFRFTDKAGKDLDAKPMGSGSYGFGGKKTYTRSFGLPKKMAKVTLHVRAYKKIEIVEVPVKLSIGLGLR